MGFCVGSLICGCCNSSLTSKFDNELISPAEIIQYFFIEIKIIKEQYLGFSDKTLQSLPYYDNIYSEKVS